MIAAGIIDPAKVTKQALVNASSIAGLMLTTEALVSEIKEEEKQSAGGAGGPEWAAWAACTKTKFSAGLCGSSAANQKRSGAIRCAFFIGVRRLRALWSAAACAGLERDDRARRTSGTEAAALQGKPCTRQA